MNTSQQNDSLYNSTLQKAIKGNKKAFGELYTYHLDEIHRYIYYRVLSRFDAEDLTETVFIKAWTALPKFDNTTYNFRAWLYRIAKNTVIDFFRTKKAVAHLSEDITNDTHLTLEQRVQIRDDYEMIARAIRDLDEKMQDVIICRFINGLSHTETAEALGLNEGYIRVLQMRGLQKIRQLLEKNHE